MSSTLVGEGSSNLSGAQAQQQVPDEQAIVRRYEQLRASVEELWQKINELEMEKQEHALVLSSLSPMDASRKCFRMIGGVLVERTVGDVMPAVERNKGGIEQVLAKLTEQMEARKKELADFQTKYKIRVKTNG
mmetsp:Transcript_7186/g.16394  ORF Transcript_7186/g.16394 Transcript_7186/m.16394 type:complete len:133 (-) Transcript_7186:80-478(-)|eukprot:CAMPEP_0198721548 /NCGR_PEP_ID=MMETSP1471-20131121/64941_1 /TAXON_ID=41880 /ORGANISM="Pycnococcus provasolii, Strain RCC733" /LENGTH=132 /DNA_ID=CAMNT_0044482439 /DNA_START=581 /DNA_END=979 /DNA_ORIENTATION=-